MSHSQPNFSEMILGWSPFKIVSVSAVLYPKWPPNMFAVSTYHLSLIVFEIKDEKY
jgi:hypothetical protein